MDTLNQNEKIIRAHHGLVLRTRIKAGRPLGDSVADMIHLTGLDRLVALYSQLTHLDCGCRARQDALNRLMPNVGIGMKSVYDGRIT